MKVSRGNVFFVGAETTYFTEYDVDTPVVTSVGLAANDAVFETATEPGCATPYQPLKASVVSIVHYRGSR